MINPLSHAWDLPLVHQESATTDPTQHPAHASVPIAIQLESVGKAYGEHKVLTDVSLTVQQGERIVICGPSGSGKSTLRCGPTLLPRSGVKSAWCFRRSISLRI
jgi:ABC-type molybdenum transport system ATPase subunit/photorepair protein PhrA